MALIKLEIEINDKGQVQKLKALDNAMDDVKKSGESLTSKLTKLISVRKILTTVVIAGTAAFIASAIAIKKAVGAFAELQAGVATTGTLIGKSVKDMGEFVSGVQDIQARTGQATSSLTKGLFDLVSAGIESGKALEVLNIAADLADGGATDVGTSVKGLVSVLNAFNLSADQATTISDQLFTAQKFGVTTVELISNSVGRLAPLMSAAGASTEEMFAALSRVTLSGIGTDEAVTSLTSVLNTLLDPLEDAKKAAREMGIELGADIVQGKGFTAVLKDIINATGGGIKAVQRLGITQRGLKAILTITGDQGKRYTEILRSLEKSTGATRTAAEQMRETFSKQADILGGKVSVIVQRIGERLVPNLEVAMRNFSKFLVKNEDTIISFGDTLAGLLRIVLTLTLRVFDLTVQIGKMFGFLDDRTSVQKAIDNLDNLETKLKNAQDRALAFTPIPLKNLIEVTDLQNQVDKATKLLEKLRKKKKDLDLTLTKRPPTPSFKEVEGIFGTLDEEFRKLNESMILQNASMVEKVNIQTERLLIKFKDIVGAQEAIFKNAAIKLLKIEKQNSKILTEERKKLLKMQRGLHRRFLKGIEFETNDFIKNNLDATKKAFKEEEMLNNIKNRAIMAGADQTARVLNALVNGTTLSFEDAWKGALTGFISTMAQMVSAAIAAGESIRAALISSGVFGIIAFLGGTLISKLTGGGVQQRQEKPVDVRIVKDDTVKESIRDLASFFKSIGEPELFQKIFPGFKIVKATLDNLAGIGRIFPVGVSPSDEVRRIQESIKTRVKRREEIIATFSPEFKKIVKDFSLPELRDLLNNLDRIGFSADASSKELAKIIESLEADFTATISAISDQFGVLQSALDDISSIIKEIENRIADLQQEQEAFKKSIGIDISTVERTFLKPEDLLTELKKDTEILRDELIGLEGEKRIQKLEELKRAIIDEFDLARKVISDTSEVEKFAEGTNSRIKAQQELDEKLAQLQNKTVDELKAIEKDGLNTFDQLISFEQNLLDIQTNQLEVMFNATTIQEAQKNLQERMVDLLKQTVDLLGFPDAIIDPGEFGLPGFAQGGIADNPMVANIAEDGPEAIIPLTRNRKVPVEINKGVASGGNTIIINVENLMARDVGDIIDEVVEDNRRRNKGDFVDFVVNQNNNLLNLIPA